jgi:bifunctional DNA-binding transcriptional regulator/antitoxin component of YhaV-PrlF toxin-antitoxin module
MPPDITRKKRGQAREGTPARRDAQGGFVMTRMDDKGRITLPAELRGALQAGTTFAIRIEGKGFVLAPIENPFDGLAGEAIEEQRAGRTRNLRDFARERNIALDDP